LVIGIYIKNDTKQKARIRWWNLKGGEKTIFKEKMCDIRDWTIEGEADQMWTEMATAIWTMIKIVLGELQR